MATLSRSDYITRYLSFDELPEDAFDVIIKDIFGVSTTEFSGDEFRARCQFMPIAIYNRGDYHTHFSLDSLGIKSVSVRNSTVPEFDSCKFSADNRFIDLVYEFWGNPERFDFQDTFFLQLDILFCIAVSFQKD